MTGTLKVEATVIPVSESNAPSSQILSPSKSVNSPPQTATQTSNIVGKALGPNVLNGTRSDTVRSNTVAPVIQPDACQPKTPQTPTANGIVKHDHRLELDKNLVAIDLKNLKENSNLVKSLQSYGLSLCTPVNGSIEGSLPPTPAAVITSTNSTASKPCMLPQPTPQTVPPSPKLSVKQPATGDDTDDSLSTHESGDADRYLLSYFYTQIAIAPTFYFVLLHFTTTLLSHH